MSGWDALAAAVAGCTACPELAAARTRTVPGELPQAGPPSTLGSPDPSTVGSGARSRSSSPSRTVDPSPAVGVMLVGEAPGASEDLAGRPFVGRAGQLLDELLATAGLARGGVAVANVLKCRPPDNRAPRRAEVLRCRGYLEAQLGLADPRVVVALGGTATRWFLGARARVTALRGQLHEVDGRRVLPTYHPSAALRFGPRGAPRALLLEDLRLAAEAARG